MKFDDDFIFSFYVVEPDIVPSGTAIDKNGRECEIDSAIFRCTYSEQGEKVREIITNYEKHKPREGRNKRMYGVRSLENEYRVNMYFGS